MERGSVEFSLDSFLSRFPAGTIGLLPGCLIFCTLSITLCTATNFGVCFFFNSFPFNSSRENSTANNFCTIFSSAFHHEICTLGSSNGSTNSVGSFSSSNTRHATARSCCTSTLFSGSAEKLVSPRVFFLDNRSHTMRHCFPRVVGEQRWRTIVSGYHFLFSLPAAMVGCWRPFSSLLSSSATTPLCASKAVVSLFVSRRFCENTYFFLL